MIIRWVFGCCKPGKRCDRCVGRGGYHNPDDLQEFNQTRVVETLPRDWLLKEK